MRNKKKILYLFGASLFVMGVVGCNSEPQPSTLGDGFGNNNMALNESQTNKNSSLKEECTEYRQMEDGSYVCLVTDSKSNTNSLFWYFMGKRFASYDTMIASKEYKENNLLNGTKKKKTSDSNKNDNKATKPSNKNNSKKNNNKTKTNRTKKRTSRRGRR